MNVVYTSIDPLSVYPPPPPSLSLSLCCPEITHSLSSRRSFPSPYLHFLSSSRLHSPPSHPSSLLRISPHLVHMPQTLFEQHHNHSYLPLVYRQPNPPRHLPPFPVHLIQRPAYLHECFFCVGSPDPQAHFLHHLHHRYRVQEQNMQASGACQEQFFILLAGATSFSYCHNPLPVLVQPPGPNFQHPPDRGVWRRTLYVNVED
mmetsp:Transcript_34933/g.109216  ORF Transcript_34933/g.109216 Transcript_34933/m.109216 type:complete len:203 (-) Transcript_34933:992-1600(-)